MEDSLARLLRALYEGHELATEGVVTRQVEGIQRSGVARGGCTEGSSTRNTEVQETGIVGNQVAILIHHTHRHEGYIPSVRREGRTVSYELEVMGLSRRADDLLLGYLASVVVGNDLDFSWLILRVHPHQAVTLLTGEVLEALGILRSVDRDGAILALMSLTLAVDEKLRLGVARVEYEIGRASCRERV